MVYAQQVGILILIGIPYRYIATCFDVVKNLTH